VCEGWVSEGWREGREYGGRRTSGEVRRVVETCGTNLKPIDVHNATQKIVVHGIKKAAPISILKMFTIQRKKSVRTTVWPQHPTSVWQPGHRWHAPLMLFVAHHYIRYISSHCCTPQRQIARNFRDLDQTTTKRRYTTTKRRYSLAL
jgi:hypothetical protein